MKAISFLKDFGRLFKTTFVNWADRDPFRNSAVIAYYTIFSLPGLLVIIVNLAGYFFGTEAVTHKITGQIAGIIGTETASDVEKIIANASISGASTISSIIGVVTLLFGATGVFYQVQQTLNIVWEVKPQPKRMIVKLIKDRAFSFGLVLIIGFLLLVSLVISAALSTVSTWVSIHFSEELMILFRVLDVAVSVGFITVLFAAIFKFLPDAKVRWKDVWAGALTTSVLFVIAKFLLGLYFGNTDPASTYGAAGSIILIMLWVTYAGMILLFGAEFTQVFANRFGRTIKPADFAVSTVDEEPPQTKKVFRSGKEKIARKANHLH